MTHSQPSGYRLQQPTGWPNALLVPIAAFSEPYEDRAHHQQQQIRNFGFGSAIGARQLNGGHPHNFGCIADQPLDNLQPIADVLQVDDDYARDLNRFGPKYDSSIHRRRRASEYRKDADMQFSNSSDMSEFSHDYIATSGSSSPAGAPKNIKHVSQQHPRQLLEQMRDLRKQRELCDLMLVVQGREIWAHRLVLSACSPYFRGMFTSNLQESNQTKVVINGVDKHAMELLINFAYTSEITIEEENVQTLLPAACLLQMEEIQKACCDFLKRQLDPSNCLGIRAFADKHFCTDLQEAADKFIRKKFQQVVQHEEFLLLPVEQLIDIIGSEDLHVEREEQVYEALRSWVTHDVEERRKHLAELMKHVRLTQLDTKFLIRVGNDLMIKADEVVRDMVDNAKNYLLLPNERNRHTGPNFRPRRAVFLDEVLFAIGGWCSGDAISTVERYDLRKHEWSMVASMSKRRCGVGVAVMENLIYAIGGHDGQSYLNTIERYDPRINQWTSTIPPTKCCRTSVGVGVLNGCLYVVGGQDGSSILNYVERYVPSTNTWEELAPMCTKRLGVSVAVLDGYLYAIGGSDGSKPHSSVERYDPDKNVWTMVSRMNTPRKHLGCAVFNNMIYVVGGRNEHTELNSAERYDPVKDTWKPIVAMSSRRSGVGLAVLNNQLYAVGGFDGQTYLKTVEVLDMEKEQWKVCSAMNFPRLGGGVGVVKLTNSNDDR